MTPAICTAVLVMARTPLVATFHASGELGWLRFGAPVWGFLMDRIDHRIAVSESRSGLAEPLAPRRVRRAPERRARTRVGSCRRPRAPHRLRRSPGSAEGAAGAASGMARDPPAERSALDGRRRRPTCGPTAPHEARRLRRRHRHRRLPEPGRSHPRAARRESARRAVSWPGELRDGADAGVRLRAARRRLGHSRLSRGSRPERGDRDPAG